MLGDNKFLMLILVACLTCVSAGQAQTTPTDVAREKQVTELIQNLGNSSFVQREQARKQLEVIGAPALDPLRRASKSPDIEIRMRALELIGRVEEQILTQQVLAAKEIHLKLTDASLEQGLAELSKLSGYQIQFTGDKKAMADKKITLDTGKTSFWQALDQFCVLAGLSEKIDPVSNASLPTPNVVRWGRMRQVEVGAAPPPSQAPILLVERKDEAEKSARVSYAGSVKTRVRLRREANSELCATFDVCAEPRLLNCTLAARPDILKALDQKSQTLLAVVDKRKNPPSTNDLLDLGEEIIRPLYRQAEVRIKEIDDGATQLKQLTGRLAVHLDLASERLARIEKILDASGRSVAGANGGTLKINSIRKVGDEFEVQVVMENLIPNPLGANVGMQNGNIVIQGNLMVQNVIIGPGGIRGAGTSGNHRDLPDLLDSKGQKYSIRQVTSDGVNIFNGSFTRTATILYQANPDQGAPSELVFDGLRSHTITVPFRFENVPIP